jgi:hypothetical protein
MVCKLCQEEEARFLSLHGYQMKQAMPNKGLA